MEICWTPVTRAGRHRFYYRVKDFGVTTYSAKRYFIFRVVMHMPHTYLFYHKLRHFHRLHGVDIQLNYIDIHIIIVWIW